MSNPAPASATTNLRPGGRSARVRASVLGETMALLVERGYAALTIGEVAKRAGVHETSIYRRWGTREALALAAALAHAEAELPPPDTGSLAGDLAWLVARVGALAVSPAGRAMLAIPAHDQPAVEEARRAYWRERFARAAGLVDRAAARGEIPGDVDPARMIEALVAPIYFRVLVTLAPVEDLPTEAHVAGVVAAARAGAFARGV